MNGEELVSLDQINAVKYEQNLFFGDTWGILLIAVLAIWFGAYCFVSCCLADIQQLINTANVIIYLTGRMGKSIESL